MIVFLFSFNNIQLDGGRF